MAASAGTRAAKHVASHAVASERMLSKAKRSCTLVLLHAQASATAAAADAPADAEKAGCAGKVLLGLKKRGFGAGFWNGFGGKVERGESITAAAHRELLEEAGVTVPAGGLRQISVIDFNFVGKDSTLEVHVFKASRFEGEPTESEEMRPQWWAAEDIPFDLMWPDDRHWFPLMLKGACFKATFDFRDTEMLSMDINECAEEEVVAAREAAEARLEEEWAELDRKEG